MSIPSTVDRHVKSDGRGGGEDRPALLATPALPPVDCYRLLLVAGEVDVTTRDVKETTTRRQKMRVSLGLEKRAQISRACDYAGLLVGGASL